MIINCICENDGEFAIQKMGEFLEKIKFSKNMSLVTLSLFNNPISNFKNINEIICHIPLNEPYGMYFLYSKDIEIGDIITFYF